MEHVPTSESYIKRVIRIAKELDISIDKAGITCDAFEEVFSDLQTRQAIFGMIEQLDESARMKGEPMGLIINYGVVVDREGIRVSRYADEIMAGEAVTLTPPDQACIFLQIKDDFPTQEVLGPMIINRPEFLTNPRSEIQNSKSNGGVVCPDREIEKPVILLGPSSLESATTVICLGPIRLKFNERFPFVVSGRPRCRSPHVGKGLTSNVRQRSTEHSSPQNLPPWAALTPAFQSTSGLSPPQTIGEGGHSVSKDVPWQMAYRFRDTRLTSGSLTI